MKKALIIGTHPLSDCLKSQFEAKGFAVELCGAEDAAKAMRTGCYDELCILSSTGGNSGHAADNEALALLNGIAASCALPRERKPVCHLLLQDEGLLRLLQTTDFYEAIRERLEVYPFTMNEVWSRTIRLDRTPITMESDTRVHLVIFGLNDVAESVAINAAHVAHYPNYVRNHALRTRITIIAEGMEAGHEGFVQKFPHLFANSFYRVVTPQAGKMVKKFHHPEFHGKREDFVDVEWEFVSASAYDKTVQEKLAYWAGDATRQLTLVFTDDDTTRNLETAARLPSAVYAHDTPLYIYAREATLFKTIAPGISGIRPFGMTDCGYDISLPYVKMAKIINHIYDQFYNDNHRSLADSDWQAHYAVEIDERAMNGSWAKLPNNKRQSNICNALNVATKLRSLGLREDEWESFYAISQQDIELMAEVEHNRWSVEELILGWRPCTDEEQAKVEADIGQKERYKKLRTHYDLRAYNDLRPDATGRSSKIYDVCLCASLPLIAKHFASAPTATDLA